MATSRSATPTIKFLKRAFDGIRPTEEPQVLRVDGQTGLRMEVTPNKQGRNGSQVSGRKSFRFVTKFDGKTIKLSLKDSRGAILYWGENVHDLESLKESLADIHGLLRQGINPNAADQLRREAATLKELYQRYCRYFEERIKSGERRQKSYEDVQGLWRNHICKHLADRRAAEITEQDAATFTSELLHRTSYAIHNKVLRLMVALYNHGIEHAKLLTLNPFAGVKRLEEPKRERRLTMEELNRLRAAMAVEKPLYQDVILVLALTGQRKHCVFSMEWREINRDKGVWYIPTSKVKSKKPHAVPLTPAVMSILERRSVEAAPGERFVFPSPRSKTGHVVEKSGEGSFWRRIIKRAGLYDENDSGQTLRVHDLRRSLASFSVERGASIQAVSKLLGHSDISITASTYAHLNVDAVRGELIETERMMLADPTTKKLEALRDQILALAPDDQARLLAMIEEMRQTAAP